MNSQSLPQKHGKTRITMARRATSKPLKEVAQQTTIRLPFFGEEVPALLAKEDGKLYLPVIELCRMLGIRADTHIPRWRTRTFWRGARKLPFHTRSGRTRIVWCLDMGSAYFLYGSFDWSLVSPQRQAQLWEATEAAIEVTSRVHSQMIKTYHRVRQSLFRFLSASDGWQEALQRRAEQYAARFAFSAALSFKELIDEGERRIGEARIQARAVLQWQADLPVIDAFTLADNGAVIDEFPLPLLPLVPREELERYFAAIDRIIEWYRSLSVFLDAQGC
jgi:hypothetical protein